MFCQQWRAERGCKTESCGQYKIDKKKTSTQSVAQLVINHFFCLCSLEADPPSNIFAQTTTARQSDSSEASATGRLVTSSPEYPDVYFEGKAASTLSDNEKRCCYWRANGKVLIFTSTHS